MAETTGAAWGLVEVGDFHDFGASDRGDNQLGDSVAARDSHGVRAEVDREDLELAAIVVIDRAGRIDHREPVVEGAAAAGSNLAFVARWNRDGDSGRDRP